MDMCNFVSKIKLDLIDWDCLMFVMALPTYFVT